jgi:hypothetical protein
MYDMMRYGECRQEGLRGEGFPWVRVKSIVLEAATF